MEITTVKATSLPDAWFQVAAERLGMKDISTMDDLLTYLKKDFS